jgi:peroxiredoxin
MWFWPFIRSPSVPFAPKKMSVSRTIFQNLHRRAEVLGVSTDSTWAIKAWVKEMGYKHHLLSDQHRTVSKAYGLYVAAKNCANRATVIIDKQGKVAWVKVQPELGAQRDEEEILKVLGGLK